MGGGPIEPGNTTINEPLGQVATDFLGPDEIDVEAVVIAIRPQATRREVYVEARLLEQFDRGILE